MRLHRNRELVVAFLAIAFFSLFLRGAYIVDRYRYETRHWEQRKYPQSFVEQDTNSYFLVALNLLQGRGFNKIKDPSHFRPYTSATPFYPLVLAMVNTLKGLNHTDVRLFKRDNPAARWIFRHGIALPLSILNHLLGTATAILVALLIFRLTGSALAAGALGLLYAVNPIKLQVDNVMLPDAFLIFWCVLALSAWVRYAQGGSHRGLWTSALLLGLATLTKPIAITLWLPFALGLAFIERGPWPRRIVRVVGFALLANVLPFLWMARNARLTGVWAISDVQNRTLMQHAATWTLARRDGISVSEAYHRLEARLRERAHDLRKKLGRPLYDAERAVLARQVGLAFILANPGWTLRTYLESLPRFWFAAPWQRWFRRLEITSMALVLWLLPCGVLWLVQRNEIGIALVLACVAGLLYLSAAPVVLYRYKAAWQPYVFILAGCGLAGLWHAAQEGFHKRTIQNTQG